MSDSRLPTELQSAIAVIGMGLRLPDATTPEEYWANLRAGVESIRRFSDEELRSAGVSESLLSDPHYVKAGVVLDGFDTWDAPFFGFNPRDAEIMDPQHRVFLECSWEALERAGHDPARFDGAIGVFAGCGMGAYMWYNLLPNRELMDSAGLFLVRHTGNDKDFLATRVSYTFDLRGPSLNIQTACSTSLVAVHTAVQHLLNGECDMALAGGVTIEMPHGHGYLYEEGEIQSPDGHCRPFERESQGTVFGSGAGVVVLRRLEDAVRDGDHIHAIIRGSAVNNDGAGKVGYLAPSVDGQAQAVAEAIAIADVDPETIGYIETHGTGTPVGDPIEVAALTQAFRARTESRGFCALGSVKSNVGHTDTAAGVVGFMKAVLSLERGEIPPSLHFRAPNPAIDFDDSPFYVNAELRPWPERPGSPRRAGVSSLGVGGTNAHVVLEESPALPASTPEPRRDHQLLVVSARTPSALESASADLADHLLGHPEQAIEDVAWTLQWGRKAFVERRAVVARDPRSAADALDGLEVDRVVTGRAADSPPGVGFMFAGGGAQYPGMGRGLYETEAVFRDALDECLLLAGPHVDQDLRSLLFPADAAAAEAATAVLQRPSLALPALFATQYAQAQLWRSWGIEPEAMIGHSMGEYTAACLAGVFTLEDAIALVAFRGRLFETLPEGGMLSVPLSEADLRPLLSQELSIAAVNGPELCVASGPVHALDALQRRLSTREVECRRIRINVAAHSSMLEPILEEFGHYVSRLTLRPPTLPVVSNLTGAWLTGGEATDPAYWVRHLRHTVRFSEGLQLLLADPGRMLLEVGPGRTLATLARIHPGRAPEQPVASSLRHPDESVHDQAFLLRVLGELWVCGVEVDWRRLRGSSRPRRVSLPTYPFERRRHWIEAPAPSSVVPAVDPLARREHTDEWLYEPVWRRAPLTPATGPSPRRLLVLAPRGDRGSRLVEGLRAMGLEVVVVLPGEELRRLAPDRFEVRAGSEGDYASLLDGLAREGGIPSRILHLWSLDEAPDGTTPAELGFHALVALARALGEADPPESLRIVICTTGSQQVGGEAVPSPAGALVLGPARVIPMEYPGITCRVVDLEPAAPDDRWERRLPELLAAELDDASEADLAAHRGGQRFIPSWEPRPRPAADAAPGPLRENAVYIVTGGLGGLGLSVARGIASEVHATLVLVGREGLPDPSSWDELVGLGHPAAARIAAVRALVELGARVHVHAADVTERADVAELVRYVDARYGRIDGVIHAAGTLDDGLIQLKTRESMEGVLAPKLAGTLALDAALGDRPLDFFILFSSVSSIAGLAGQVDYAAANAFLDAFAHHRTAAGRGLTVSIGWSAWRDVGMTAALARSEGPEDSGGLEGQGVAHPLLERLERLADGVEVFAAELSPERHWILGEHRLRDGDPLIPGTGYLELARAAFETRAGEGATELRDVFFMSPFMVPEGASRRLRIELTRSNGCADFVVLGEVDEGEWEEHVRGSIGRAAVTPPEPVRIEELHSRCRASGHAPNGDHPYLKFGPRWGNVRSILYGSHEALAALELPSRFESDLGDYKLHPALLDMATAGAQSLIEGYDGHDDFYVPIGYGSVRLRRALPARCYSHIRHHRAEEGRNDIAVFDVTLLDEAGDEVAEIRDFTMKRVPADALKRPATPVATVRRASSRPRASIDMSDAIRPEEGAAVFARILEARVGPHVLVSPKDLRAQLREWRRPVGAASRAPRSSDAEDPRLAADLGQIASALLELEAVVDAAAVAKKGRGGERRLLAYVVYAPGESATVSELRRHAKDRLPKHLVPSNFVDVDTIPRRPDGVPDVGALPDPFADVDTHVAPRSETEKRIAEVWRDVLGVEQVGLHDNFFDIGGHSLLAVRVITRIQRELGHRLDQAVMVLHTLEQIAAKCDQRSGSGGAQREELAVVG